MAYLKPPWFTVRVFNRIAMATGVSNTETLTVTKRGSGESQQIPVVTVEVGGTRYLVSTRGESQWVKNVRANPTVTLTGGGNPTTPAAPTALLTNGVVTGISDAQSPWSAAVAQA